MMSTSSLTDYLSATGRVNAAALDALRYEFDKRLYYYGEQFRRPFEGHRSVLLKIAGLLRDLVRSNSTRTSRGESIDIQSSAYSSVNRELQKLGYSVMLPPWLGAEWGFDAAGRSAIRRLQRTFREANFSELLEVDFAELLNDVEKVLRDYYRQMKALVVPFDIGYFENVSVRLFQGLGKPAFVFLHGLPGRYNDIDDNRADYLLVWGEAIKQHYAAAGVNPGKIIVAGHPEFSSTAVTVSRNCTNDVLVITKSMAGAQPISGQTIVSNRSDCLLYMYLVEDSLKRSGVRKARFRPHPSESGDWYRRFLDTDFYRLDDRPLDESLRVATLVIGPTSTVFLNALVSGVNYVVFEPVRAGTDLLGFPLVPPFDGSDSRLPVAHDVDRLDHLLKTGASVDARVMHDYVRPEFDISSIRRIVG